MCSQRTIKVGIYGAGSHALNNHLLNLMRLEDVEVVAVCDIVEENARQAAADFGISRSYTDGHEMVKNEPLDALWSTVVAAAREDGVEVAAAEKGIHLFIEKPQAMDPHACQRERCRVGTVPWSCAPLSSDGDLTLWIIVVI